MAWPIQTLVLVVILAVVNCLRMPGRVSTIFLRSGGGKEKYRVLAARRSPRVEIEYCSKCKWMLRSAYLAQELLSTFETVLKEVALVPNQSIAGTFLVRLDDSIIWDRKIENGFPDAKQLKQRVRDIVEPTRSLGHSDVKIVEVKE